MLGNLSVEGIDLSIMYGVYATDAAIYNMPSADVQTVSILGRSGDLIISRDRYSNIQVRYPCVMPVYNAAQMNQLRAWLLKDVGYLRIEDSFDTEHFRQGRFVGNVAVSSTMDGTAMTFELVFDCKPQRYFKSGETERTVTEATTAGYVMWQEENPSPFSALPYIRIVKPSTSTESEDILLFENGVRIMRIAGIAASAAVEIDSAMQDVYFGSTNLNANVTATYKSGFVFPVLTNAETLGNKARISAIIDTSPYTAVESLTVAPRWWEL